MKIFIVVWKDGTKTVARGEDLEDALFRAGYSPDIKVKIQSFEEVIKEK